MNNTELQAKTEFWAETRQIYKYGNPHTQFLKLAEELGELGSALAKDDLVESKDAIGDMVVVLTNLSKLLDTDLNTCWNIAYKEIKDRKGTMNHLGNFIKDTK